MNEKNKKTFWILSLIIISMTILFVANRRGMQDIDWLEWSTEMRGKFKFNFILHGRRNKNAAFREISMKHLMNPYHAYAKPIECTKSAIFIFRFIGLPGTIRLSFLYHSYWMRCHITEETLGNKKYISEQLLIFCLENNFDL